MDETTYEKWDEIKVLKIKFKNARGKLIGWAKGYEPFLVEVVWKFVKRDFGKIHVFLGRGQWSTRPQLSLLVLLSWPLILREAN